MGCSLHCVVFGKERFSEARRVSSLGRRKIVQHRLLGGGEMLGLAAWSTIGYRLEP